MAYATLRYQQTLTEHQKINYPILWDGHPARPWWLPGFSSRTTRNFWVFF